MKMKFPDKWAYQVTDTNDVETKVRANLTSEIEAIDWVKEYSILNNTGWNVGYHYANNKFTTRYALHKRWVCHVSKYNKRSSSRRCTCCEASIDIYIKVMTKNTRYIDAFLRLSPPLRAIITISSVHNHDTESTESLQLLRGGDHTKRIFAEYFDTGLPVATAIRLHQARLRATDSSEKFLANRSINPTNNMIYYWYALHKAGKLKNVDDPSTMPPEEKDLCESAGNNSCRQLDADGSAVMADVERVWLLAMEGDPPADPNTELPTVKDPIGTVLEEINEEIREGDVSTGISPSFIPPVSGEQCDVQPVDNGSSTVASQPPPRKKIPYACDECPKAFRQKDNLTRHMATKHGSVHRPYYSCDICSRTFLHKRNLRPHTASHAAPPDESRKSAPDPQAPVESRGGTLEIASGRVEPSGPFGCRKCRDGFARTEDLAAHILTHAVGILPAPARLEPRGDGPRTGQERSLDPARESHAAAGRATDEDGPFAGLEAVSGRKISMRQRLDGIEAKKFSCAVPVCDKRYSRKKQLKVHILSHFPVNSNPCTVCGESFCRNVDCSFKMYESIKCAYRTLLACMYCAALFTTSRKREEHMKSHFFMLSTGINVPSRTAVDLEHVVPQDVPTLPSELSVLVDAEVRDIKEPLLVTRPIGDEETQQSLVTRPIKDAETQQLLPAYDLSESFVTKIEEMTDVEPCPSSQALGNSYPCSICSKNFCRKCYLSKHGSADAPLICESCSTVFQVRCKLEKHVESHADEPSAEASGNGSEVDADYIEEQEMSCSPRENPGMLVDTKEFEEEGMTCSPLATPGMLADTKEFEEEEMPYLPREALGMLVDTKEFEEEGMTCFPRGTPGMLVHTKEFKEEEMPYLPRETPGTLVDTKELEERLRVTVVEAQLETQQSLPVSDFLNSVVDIKQEITVGDVESPGATLHDEFRGTDLENTNV